MKCKDVFLYNFTQVCCRSGTRLTVEQLEQRRNYFKDQIIKNRQAKKQAQR